MLLCFLPRTNLAITVRHQKPGGLAENFRFLEEAFSGQVPGTGGGGGTIVYVPTTKGVESVATHLSSVLPAAVKVVSRQAK